MMPEKMFAAFFLIAAAVVASFAQSPETSVLSARERFSDIKNRSVELERAKREAARRPIPSDDGRTLPQIKEDFEQIQKINIKVFQTPAGNSPTDYNAVLKAAAEIKHHAAHLKSVLFPYELEEKPAQNQNADSKNLQALFGELDRSIARFVHNSIFQNIEIVDPKDSVKAQIDLEKVIKISSLIKKKTKSLLKESSEK